MNRFAALLDQLAFEPGRNGKLALITGHFRDVPDPARGYALAALTGGLDFAKLKSGLIRALIEERTDPVLFRMSYDYVGDLSETVALLWPQAGDASSPTLPEVVGRRVGVSVRLAKTALAALGPHSVQDVEELWRGLVPPYEELFAWAEGSGVWPDTVSPAPFRPPMLAHPIEEGDFDKLDASAFLGD